MTESRLDWATLSANDTFKADYGKTLRWSVLAALIILGILAWFSPHYEPAPYELHRTEMEIVEIADPVIVEEKPQVAPPPVVPVEIEPVDDDDPRAVDVPPLVGIGDPFPAPPPVRQPDEGFVASSARPVLVSRAKPHYPEVARLAQVEGTVVVKVLVGIDGRVEEAAILQGAHPLLERAALAAARRCVFAPGKQRGMPVRAWMALPYNFRLR